MSKISKSIKSSLAAIVMASPLFAADMVTFANKNGNQYNYNLTNQSTAPLTQFTTQIGAYDAATGANIFAPGWSVLSTSDFDVDGDTIPDGKKVTFGAASALSHLYPGDSLSYVVGSTSAQMQAQPVNFATQGAGSFTENVSQPYYSSLAANAGKTVVGLQNIVARSLPVKGISADATTVRLAGGGQTDLYDKTLVPLAVANNPHNSSVGLGDLATGVSRNSNTIQLTNGNTLETYSNTNPNTITGIYVALEPLLGVGGTVSDPKGSYPTVMTAAGAFKTVNLSKNSISGANWTLPNTAGVEGIDHVLRYAGKSTTKSDYVTLIARNDGTFSAHDSTGKVLRSYVINPKPGALNDVAFERDTGYLYVGGTTATGAGWGARNDFNTQFGELSSMLVVPKGGKK